jgi:hypothetical protein
MFGKKQCSNCRKKSSKNFDFCPYCGSSFRNPAREKEEFGLLGKEDSLGIADPMFSRQAGGMNNILSNAIKIAQDLLNEEMQPSKKQAMPNINPGFELYINGQKVPLNVPQPRIEQKPSKPAQNTIKINEELIKNSSKLPRKEAKTHLTRTSDKVIYELDTPGLDSIHKVLISKLENSIEVRAYTEKAVFFKNLPIKLPLIQYAIREGKLFLEFKAG